MPLYSSDEANRPNPRVAYYKQWEKIDDGEYLVTRIFKPRAYPSAGLCTSAFRVSVPVKVWEELRQPLLKAYKEGKAVSIVTNRGSYEIEVSSNFKPNYKADEHGIVHEYKEDEILFIPSTTAKTKQGSAVDLSNPF